MTWQGSLAAARETVHHRSGDVDIRVWVPACGDGRPTFEVAAAFVEVLGDEEFLARVHVCGTSPDVDDVRGARDGRFAPRALAGLPEDVSAHFFPVHEEQRAFRDDLRGAVSFARNDLVRDRPLRRVDLIDARRLFQDGPGPGHEALARLVSSLRPGGLLRVPDEAGLDIDDLPVQLDQLVGIPGLWERTVEPTAPDLGSAWRPKTPIRMIVVNEHDLFVRGLGVLLESMFGRFVTVVAVSHDPSTVLDLIEREQPDLVLVDVTGPTSAGLPARIRERYEHVPVLALAEDPHEAWREVVAGGSAGVVPRSVSADELVGPLLAVAEGLAVLPPEAVRSLVRGVPSERLSLLDELSSEELQLWAWVAEGKQDNEIADHLFVSSRTVKRRIGSLLRKLDVGRRVEAAELAGRFGLLAHMTVADQAAQSAPVMSG